MSFSPKANAVITKTKSIFASIFGCLFIFVYFAVGIIVTYYGFQVLWGFIKAVF